MLQFSIIHCAAFDSPEYSCVACLADARINLKNANRASAHTLILGGPEQLLFL